MKYNIFPFNLSYNSLYYLVNSYIDPVPWIINKHSDSILDLACSEGNGTKIIKQRRNVSYVVGVELFEPYLKVARASNIFNKVIRQDVRKINFPDKSFDIVLLNQIIEHLTKKEAWELIKKAERIARKQVVIATPIGPCFHPAVDGNKLQLHKSYYYPEEFEKRGFKTIKYGWKYLLDSHKFGLLHRVKTPMLRRAIYVINILLTPIYYLFQSSCDYIFVAYKEMM